MKKQVEWWGIEKIDELKKVLEETAIKKIMLVCGNSYEKNREKLQLENLSVEIKRFSDFSPNPSWESVREGIRRFSENGCEAILAVGGGSALDVAKCIKLYANELDKWENFSTDIKANAIKLFAIPTTAGSGSEMTKFAVVYKNGVKYSIQDESLLYDYVLYEGSLLNSLPIYQKKATVMDVFSHTIESYWSLNSTEESKEYAQKAMRIALDNIWNYMEDADDLLVNENMLMAANFAGKAINISKTTAGHALSYKITELYGMAHGHAAALCTESVWRYILMHLEQCIEPRGECYLKKTMEELAFLFGKNGLQDGLNRFAEILKRLDLLEMGKRKENDLEVIVHSVNEERLKNTPIRLEEKDLYIIVERLFDKITNKTK